MGGTPPADRWKRLSIDDSPGLIGIHDLDGNILYMNRAAAAALGYEPAAMVGRHFTDFVAPSVRPYFAPAMDRVRQDRVGEGVVLMVAKDGSQRRWWYRHVIFDADGEAPVVLGDSTDITDIHSASEALQESEQRFRYLAENIHQVFWLRDPRTSQILYLSPAFEEVWGRPRSWMIDQPWAFLDTVHADDRQMLLENFVKSGHGETTLMEYRILRPDGAERWIWSHAFPVRDAGGEVARVIAITEDISERKQAEEELRRARDAAEEATRDKSLLLAHVSHEVRTPLNIIFGLAEMLVDSGLSPEQQQDVQRIVRAAHTLNTLSNDLLDFSKIGSRNLELRSEPVDVRAILGMAMEAFVNKPRAGVDVVGTVAPDVPPLLVGDPERLRQVLANLIGNANKFTERGSIVTTIGVAERDAAGVLLRCEVCDSGRGIPLQDQQRIFEPFSQAHTATKRDERGVGLGLAICAQLVKFMGGEIGVDSEPGKGSTFWFTVRLALAHAPPAS